MLTNDQLQTLKKTLEQTKEDLQMRLNGQHYGREFEFPKESVSELSNYDNHPGDLGTELFEREKDIALNEHSEHVLQEVVQSLKEMEQGSYGKCEACGIEIPYERLEAVPTARRCIKHTEENKVTNNRPEEEDVIAPAFGKFDYDESSRNETFFDAEDSWQAVSVYGSSETPSDFNNTDNKDYNNMFVESDEPVGIVEEVEGILTADIEGNYSGVSIDHKRYEKYLDENRALSVFDRNDENENR
ncbi:TraR/DksA C4-type zinc finger protein [Salipaludibacillus daqingensis]|uniref:TraR/DksA C4-type zinc finger protein n=1 Tax=Salipaludibacillus daqingensis TaxID=3041001 RepID=UPI0024744348|nr:TraR/DksA C4-type zinc finger protein [Salipaludibacillus daqingensis]